jgi:transcription antitermination factor NusG
MTESDWYVITFRPNQSTRAERNLAEQGVTCYVPRMKSVKALKRRRELFPGYGFIRSGDAVRLSAVSSTPGVARLLQFNDRPAIISDDWVSAIKGQVARMEDEQAGLRHLLHQTVLIRVGASQGLNSLVTDVDDARGMVRVVYYMLGSPQEAWVEMSIIEECRR